MFAAVSLSTWHEPGSYRITIGLLIFIIENVCVSSKVETNFESYDFEVITECESGKIGKLIILENF